jgi:hypothetical protein
MRVQDFQVLDDPAGLSRTLPDDYKYKDGKPGDVILPAVIYGEMPKMAGNEHRRVAFAAWLTGHERFAMTIANRMWKRAFGLGIGEPVTGIEDLNGTENPLLLKFLSAEMRRLHFDLRAFEEILYNTRAYQRQASTGVVERGAAYHFPGPVLRRMTAEQIWDSYLTMILPDVDYFYRKRDRPGERFGWAPHPEVKDEDVVYLDERYHTYRIHNEVLIRASEFPQQLGANSLMRNLGQSDRLLIDGGQTTGSVPIVLAMMNSEGTINLTRPGSRILDAIDKGRAVGPKLETAFLSILNRMPNAEERSRAYKAINRDGADGFKNVVWALINTREFLFIQ